jgi:hypothetical protein
MWTLAATLLLQILGIDIKPTALWALRGYLGAAVTALVSQYLLQVFNVISPVSE